LTAAEALTAPWHETACIKPVPSRGTSKVDSIEPSIYAAIATTNDRALFPKILPAIPLEKFGFQAGNAWPAQ
jgi:hypothetical protein